MTRYLPTSQLGGQSAVITAWGGVCSLDIVNANASSAIVTWEHFLTDEATATILSEFKPAHSFDIVDGHGKARIKYANGAIYPWYIVNIPTGGEVNFHASWIMA